VRQSSNPLIAKALPSYRIPPVSSCPNPVPYAGLINLHVPFDRNPRGGNRLVLLEDICTRLLADAELTDQDVPAGGEARRRLINILLTLRQSRPMPPDLHQMLDDLLGGEAAERPLVDIETHRSCPDASPPIAGTALKLWRGDITTLGVDAIVNAANSGLLGCFRPSHPCIDNAIHAAAGPRLREDCSRIIDLQGHPEPTGTAKITRAYYLPSRFVLHTVGPIVANKQVTDEHRESLASCYEACLDLAAAVGVKSLAFCSISTGVFGYPKLEAAELAMGTVRHWVQRHPGALDLVIFNVFSAADEQAYHHAASPCVTITVNTPALGDEVQQIRRWIEEADRVLIGAGGGLSADAGVDYTDEADFAAKFPTLVKRGIRMAYQMIGYSDLPPEAFWGYWLQHVNEVRFGDGRRRVYQHLFNLTRGKDCFVLTSNVDALFARNGFDPARVCSIQGDFAFLQCLTPCSKHLWPSAPVLERLLPEIDSETQALRDPAQAPTCPKCSGQVFFNVRGGDWFVEEPWRRQFGVLREWITSQSNERLLVLDIGSGFNTPSVVRWPMERTAKAIPTSRFVRINRHHPELHVDLGSRALTIGASALEVLDKVVQASG
jgi:O-acetyl-ADP-ribose deacetylase (regulator of RNase III)/NAD-dependent SIR2 family protein deacetylase